MKKTILILVWALTANLAFAQSNIFPGQGNVGIGTTTPQEKLELKGNILISNADIPLGLNTEVGGTSPLFNMSLNFREAHRNNTFLGAAFRIDSRPSLPLFQWLKRDASTDTESVIMSLNINGNLGLGVTNPTEKLSVNGNIRAKEIKVEAANWPDYVFKQGYPLSDLQTLSAFIKANQHLPEVPSAAEVESSGLNVGEMNKLLLKKIEELTLHFINQNDKLISQNEKIEALGIELKRLTTGKR